MTEDLSKLSKRELVLELEEVKGLLQDTSLTLQRERETSASKIAGLEEAVEKGNLECASADSRVQLFQDNSVRMERISFEDRQALKNAEKVIADVQNKLVAMGLKYHKERAKRKKEDLKRRELEQKLMELKNVKEPKEETNREESHQGGVTAEGNALDTTGDSRTVGHD